MKKIKWLSEQPKLTSGVTWGVPWKKGELKKGDRLALMNENAETRYVQSEPSVLLAGREHQVDEARGGVWRSGKPKLYSSQKRSAATN
nr:hypothetical protein P5668_21940 [Bacillus subtilis]